MIVTSRTTELVTSFTAQAPSPISIRPMIRPSHQSCRCVFMNARITSRMPAISRNQPTSIESASTVLYGLANATIPATIATIPPMMKNHLHPPATADDAKMKLKPTKMNAIPARMPSTSSVSVRIEKTQEAEDHERDPGREQPAPHPCRLLH